MADKKENTKTLAQNKKARHEYFILETIEAGIELAGTEVKSARLGKVNLTDAYASIKNGEVFIKQMNISPFEQGNIFNRDPLRDRKLLLHKKEILKLTNQIQQDGYALIPLAVYLKGSLVKVSLAVAKGKKLYDKREDIAKKDAKRNIERPLENKQLIENDCSKCHDDLEKKVKDIQASEEERVTAISEKIEDMTNKIAAKYADEIAAMKAANEAKTDIPAASEELAKLQKLQRNAQFYWDFVMVENSEGAHNSKLTNETLDKAEAAADEALAMLA